jgi:aconitate hydratase
VVAFGLAGTTLIDMTTEPLGQDSQGDDIYLKDIWPSDDEVAEMVKLVSADMFREKYADVFAGEESWQSLPVPEGQTYDWVDDSTYVKEPSFFEVREKGPAGLEGFTGARLLALLGDSITTDHISPAGSILASSPAGVYLRAHGTSAADFNSYGSRRGNHEVMMRGTFANIRLKNELVPGVEGGFTRLLPGDEPLSIFDAAMRYAGTNTPLVIMAGKEYGTGSSRDWAAKGTLLLGVRAVIAESYERIHRSNLVGMGVLPLQFKAGDDRKALGIDGSETFDLIGQVTPLEPGQDIVLRVKRADGESQELVVTCRIDTADEVQYFQSGGILNYVLRNLMK